tara:strand:+ start:276 stop:440 length:165 start_codon:yes stop_codon:yes gene_type:complete
MFILGSETIVSEPKINIRDRKNLFIFIDLIYYLPPPLPLDEALELLPLEGLDEL